MERERITESWQPTDHIDPDLLWFLNRINAVEFKSHPVLWCTVVRLKPTNGDNE